MTKDRIGILLLNLGTPKNFDVRSVRNFLREFLDDPHVIEIPWLLRKCLLYFFILPFRTAKTAKAYAAIWDKERGSPLLFHSLEMARKLQAELGSRFQVELGMRYSSPSIRQGISKLMSCHKIIVLPLYPQYSHAATGSAIDELVKWYATWRDKKALTIKDMFFNDPHFIGSWISILQPYCVANPEAHLIFSYHSLPVRQILKSKQNCSKSCFQNMACPRIDANNYHCYRAQCFESSHLIAQGLALSNHQYSVVFQSQVGKAAWIGPHLQNDVLSNLLARGIKDLTVACPSFVTDCLETLEEIGLRVRKQWLQLGGRDLKLAPCLNDSSPWIKTIANWANQIN
ncbi:MAG: ferrochelatase [Proteobacteria bacterium]|nr:ferrochelatase [Pseudomonadota bacterium]